MKHCETDFFADETTLYTNSKNIDTIENNFQNDLAKMKINYNKPTCMAVGTKKKSKQPDSV